MKLVNKETKEITEVAFSTYSYNPIKKVKEEGIVVIIPGKKAYHYPTILEMLEAWEDAPKEEAKEEE